MQSLALFDLDDTLVDRRAAFQAWAEEFVVTQGLGEAALTFLLMADAHHSGPMDSFFTTVCQTFDLARPPEQLWEQYRRRMPELASCRPEVSIRKPDPEIFRLTADRCGTNCGNGGWMIGDSLVLDVAGGQAAGLRTIWLQPKRRPEPWSFVGPVPDAAVDSVADAVEVLLEA